MENTRSNVSNTPQPTNAPKPILAEQDPATGSPGEPLQALAGLLADCLEVALKAGGDAREVATRAAACAVSRIVGVAGPPVSQNPEPEKVKPNPSPGQPPADK